MVERDQDYLEKSLQQFESCPYPNIPIEESPKNNLKLLYESSLVTARYRRDGVVITDLDKRVMLDVACGTGATTLTMALANPGAAIIGVDISPESIKIAEKRLKYHKIENVEFHVLALENLEQLGLTFDYIGANDILYLLPDLTFALNQLRKVLKLDGIIRGNLHSYYQRLAYFRSQDLFKQMGLMEDNPGQTEMEIVREFFDSLHDNVDLKLRAWGNNFDKNDPQQLLSNHLLQNDKGFTVPQLLKCLADSELELISMVDWRNWNWRQLFKEPDNLPAYLAMGLENSDMAEQLCFYELIQPNKRLLDFWCGHPQSAQSIEKINWRDLNSKQVKIHFHPCLRSETFQKALLEPAAIMPLNLGTYFGFLVNNAWVDRSLMTVIFAPLLNAPQTLESLIDCWRQVRPIDPLTLSPIDETTATLIMQSAIADQEQLGILMLEVSTYQLQNAS